MGFEEEREGEFWKRKRCGKRLFVTAFVPSILVERIPLVWTFVLGWLIFLLVSKWSVVVGFLWRFSRGCRMTFRSTFGPSVIDEILGRGEAAEKDEPIDPLLFELLDESDLLTEANSDRKRLIQFLARPEVMTVWKIGKSTLARRLDSCWSLTAGVGLLFWCLPPGSSLWTLCSNVAGTSQVLY